MLIAGLLLCLPGGGEREARSGSSREPFFLFMDRCGFPGPGESEVVLVVFERPGLFALEAELPMLEQHQSLLSTQKITTTDLFVALCLYIHRYSPYQITDPAAFRTPFLGYLPCAWPIGLYLCRRIAVYFRISARPAYLTDDLGVTTLADPSYQCSTVIQRVNQQRAF